MILFALYFFSLSISLYLLSFLISYLHALAHISVQVTGPFLHLGALAAVTALSWIVAGQVAHAEKTSTLTCATQNTSYCHLM